jgi:leucine dehydrogenase
MGRVAGVSQSGDPSPFTAAGVFAGMRAALMQAFGSPELANRRVAVQGIGNVGFALARLVCEAGGSLVVADSRREAAERARRDLGAAVTEPDSIYDEDCDVFAPCAMGATLNESTVRRLRAKVVCGAANNQLASAAVGKLLVEREIVYAPDYVVNAGGMLNASGDFFGRYDAEAVWPRVRGIEDTARKVLALAAAERRPPHEVADELARAIVEDHRRKARPPAGG